MLREKRGKQINACPFFFAGGKMRIIVVASIKGEVGETVESSSLARNLKRPGFSVGYLDTDITGGICWITYLDARQKSAT